LSIAFSGSRCDLTHSPFLDNQPYVTEALKKVLKDEYNYDSTVCPSPVPNLIHSNDFYTKNTFRALYRTFTQCCFIEDDGDIVFYKNKDGKALRVLAEGALDNEVKKTA